MSVKGIERLIPKCDELFDPNEVTYEVFGWVFALGRKKKNDLTRRENRSGEKTTQFKILRRAMFLKVGLRPLPETHIGGGHPQQNQSKGR